MIDLGRTATDKCIVIDYSTGGAWDETDELVSPSLNAEFRAGSTNDAMYFGHLYNQFLRLSCSVIGGAGATVTWEYYSNNGWTNASVVDETDSFTVSGSGDVYAPSAITVNWEKTTVGGTTAYWWRARVSSGSYTTNPSLAGGCPHLTLPDPNIRLDREYLGTLHVSANGTRVWDEIAQKRRVRLSWPLLTEDQSLSVRERAAFSQAACLAFWSGWTEDEWPDEFLVNPQGGYTERYIPPEYRQVELVLIEV